MKKSKSEIIEKTFGSWKTKDSEVSYTRKIRDKAEEREKLVLEYAKGNVTEKELQEVFGDETAKIIKFTLKKIKSDFEKAQKVAETISKGKNQKSS